MNFYGHLVRKKTLNTKLALFADNYLFTMSVKCAKTDDEIKETQGVEQAKQPPSKI